MDEDLEELGPALEARFLSGLERGEPDPALWAGLLRCTHRFVPGPLWADLEEVDPGEDVARCVEVRNRPPCAGRPAEALTLLLTPLQGVEPPHYEESLVVAIEDVLVRCETIRWVHALGRRLGNDYAVAATELLAPIVAQLLAVRLLGPGERIGPAVGLEGEPLRRVRFEPGGARIVPA